MSEREQQEDAFGFGAVSNATKERIRNIKPSLPPEVPTELARVDAVADQAGFVSREATPVAGLPPYEYRSSRQARPEPRIPLNMRVPVTLGNAFQRFCEEHRYSYPEALAVVMKMAGLPLS